MDRQPDVNIYRHRAGWSVYYVSERGQFFQAQLAATRTRETWPAIDELVRLMHAQDIVISYTRSPDVVDN